MIWQPVLSHRQDPMPDVSQIGSCLARHTVALARECLAESFESPPDDVDPWACLRAALLNLGV